MEHEARAQVPAALDAPVRLSMLIPTAQPQRNRRASARQGTEHGAVSAQPSTRRLVWPGSVGNQLIQLGDTRLTNGLGNIAKKNGKDPPCFMGKLTISTGPWLQ